jgi:hypothetical protein
MEKDVQRTDVRGEIFEEEPRMRENIWLRKKNHAEGGTFENGRRTFASAEKKWW